MNAFDVVIVGLLAGSLVLGANLGVVRTLFSIIGLAVGVVVAFLVTRKVMLDQAPQATTARNWIFVGGFFGLPVLGWIVGGYLAKALRDESRLAGPERGFGALLAGGSMVLVIWLVVPASRTSTVLASWSSRSETSRLLKVVPAPPIDVGSLIAQDSFPAHLSQLLGVEDLTNPPTVLPDIASSLLARAEQASVQIMVKSCGGFWDGSGFAIGPNLIATNAHVVAGSTTAAHVVAHGRSADANVVLFDPGRDFALLSVTGLDLPVLHLDSRPVRPQEIVVTLGHPNGQHGLDVGPARVVDQKFEPDTDPYGNKVYRSTILLSTSGHVYPGSSGSAVLDSAGDAIGIVYAGPGEGTGYALAISAAEIAPELLAAGSTPVSAGQCNGLQK